MSGHEFRAAPVKSVPFFTRGVMVVMAVALVGWGFGLFRMIFGLEAATNLNDQYPWGLWIAIDVATGVALAAGGFTSAALAHIFHRGKYNPLTRAALLTAALGYTFVAIGLLFDLGRYYNVWHPIFFWQGNSVLFEVGMCVTIYLTVLYLEFLPIVAERFRDGITLPGPLRRLGPLLHALLRLGDKITSKMMWALIIAGVVLSTMHQSSLGALMVIAPTKMHPLWYTPILPLLFLASAIAVGLAMVVFESLVASRSFKRTPEMGALTPLARLLPLVLGFYLALKVGDLVIRDAWPYLLVWSTETMMFLLEVVLCGILPLAMLFLAPFQRRPGLLFIPAALIIAGVAINRVNVFLVAYKPPFATESYFPSVAEFAVTAGLIATIVLIYRFAALNLPIMESEEESA
jgi:Ni/Fe-hydrogenase subunit HybB-like protein